MSAPLAAEDTFIHPARSPGSVVDVNREQRRDPLLWMAVGLLLFVAALAGALVLVRG
jgi:hypothetical protein